MPVAALCGSFFSGKFFFGDLIGDSIEDAHNQRAKPVTTADEAKEGPRQAAIMGSAPNTVRCREAKAEHLQRACL